MQGESALTIPADLGVADAAQAHGAVLEWAAQAAPGTALQIALSGGPPTQVALQLLLAGASAARAGGAILQPCPAARAALAADRSGPPAATGEESEL